MIVTYLSGIMARDLRGLRREVEAYPDDASLWTTHPGLPNTAGNLVLHLSGNLQHFVGAVLGATGYQRDRDAEFARRNVPRKELLAEIDATSRAVTTTLAALTPAQLEAPFPIAVGKVQVNTLDFLLHLATHLTYHLGQVDYHRRIATGMTAGVGAVPPAELKSAAPM